MKRIATWVKQQAKLASGIAAGVIVGAAGSAVVLASIPGPGGVIKGCYKTNKGTLTVIDSAANCAAGETLLTWNQTGPAGATGATGSQGPIGPQGPPGTSGGGTAIFCPDCFIHASAANYLSGKNLTGSFFGRGNFNSGDFSHTNFTNSIMDNAAIDSSNLTDVNFTGANLSGSELAFNTYGSTNFTNANLADALFDHCDLHTSILAGANLGGTQFKHCNLSGMDLRTAVFNPSANTNFLSDTFTNMNFSGQTFNPYIAGDLTGTNFSGITVPAGGNNDALIAGTVTNVNFSNADFGGQPVAMNGVSGSNTNFTGATLAGANMSGVQLDTPNFTNTNLVGVIFNASSVLTNAIWSNTTCPDSTNSNANGNTCIGHLGF